MEEYTKSSLHLIRQVLYQGYLPEEGFTGICSLGDSNLVAIEGNIVTFQEYVKKFNIPEKELMILKLKYGNRFI